MALYVCLKLCCLYGSVCVSIALCVYRSVFVSIVLFLCRYLHIYVYRSVFESSSIFVVSKALYNVSLAPHLCL